MGGYQKTGAAEGTRNRSRGVNQKQEQVKEPEIGAGREPETEAEEGTRNSSREGTRNQGSGGNQKQEQEREPETGAGERIRNSSRGGNQKQEQAWEPQKQEQERKQLKQNKELRV